MPSLGATKHLNTANNKNENKTTENLPFRIKISPIITLYLFTIYNIIIYLFGTKKQINVEKSREGYPNLFNFKSELVLWYYQYARCFSGFPIFTVPGTEFELKRIVTADYGRTIKYENVRKCINLASYNYLGFAQNQGPCAQQVEQAILDNGIAFASSRREFGTHKIHKELETLTAQYLGVEDSITFGMGFATNVLNIPVLLSSDCLVLSDEKNHSSIVLGVRMSKSTVKVFRHNNMNHLEKMLIEGLVERHNKTGKPWKKIFIIIEGIYSMEGTIVNLPEVLKIKKKYNAYIYLDEAHSIGSLGKHGRGVLDHYQIESKDIDILMGTFTKSFGSAGGYIAGTKTLINYLRVHGHAASYAGSMSIPVAQQIVSSMKILMGLDGTTIGRDRLNRLARNTRYFRLRLRQLGLIVMGNKESPVVPFLVAIPSKLPMMLEYAFSKGVAFVCVCYPATEFDGSRIRICLSAEHTKEQLDYALQTINELADKIDLRYSRMPRDTISIEY